MQGARPAHSTSRARSLFDPGRGRLADPAPAAEEAGQDAAKKARSGLHIVRACVRCAYPVDG